MIQIWGGSDFQLYYQPTLTHYIHTADSVVEVSGIKTILSEEKLQKK